MFKDTDETTFAERSASPQERLLRFASSDFERSDNPEGQRRRQSKPRLTQRRMITATRSVAVAAGGGSYVGVCQEHALAEARNLDRPLMPLAGQWNR